MGTSYDFLDDVKILSAAYLERFLLLFTELYVSKLSFVTYYYKWGTTGTSVGGLTEVKTPICCC